MAFKIVHEIRTDETEPKLADLVTRLKRQRRFEDRKVLYSWVGGHAATGAARGTSER